MADKKNTLSQEFDRIQNKIETLFRPIYDPIDEFFFKLVAEFQKAGVDFLEVNQGKKSAIAKHSNYYEYPERRYAVTVNDKNKVKFYELEYSNSEAPSSPTAKEISQKEFEDLTIPTYLKPNPLMSKEDQEEDKDPEADYEEGTKKKDDKDAITKEKPKDHPEIKKKTVEYGDTLSPKKKEKVDEAVKSSFAVGLDRAKRPAANQGHTIDTPDTYTGTVGNLGPMEEQGGMEAVLGGEEIGAEGSAEVVSDNDKATVYNIKSVEDACKIGKGTKWCISAKGPRNYFNSYKYGRGYNIYIIVSKTNPNEKYAIAVDTKGKKEMFDAGDHRVSDMNSVLKKFGLGGGVEETLHTSATPAPGITDGRPGNYPEDTMAEDRASKFAKDKQAITITKDQRKEQEKKYAKKKAR